jgi:hypothetical protein
MHQICGEMGYCGSVIDGESRHVQMYIPESGPVTADQFVEWVFLAEGLDLVGSSHADQMRKAFIEFMGSYVVDAEMLQYSIVRNQSSSSS